MARNENGPILQFASFQSSVDEGFWHGLCSLKLNKLKTDESPISITGFYAPCSNSHVSSHLTLLTDSLPTEPSDEPSIETNRGNRNKCAVPGTLYNTNTKEGFEALDKQGLLKAEAKKIWEDIRSGKAEEDGSVLLRFLLISFADLKKFNFNYWFAFPGMVLDPPATLVDLRPASKWFTQDEAESVLSCCNEWRMSSLTTDMPFFLVSISSNSHATTRPLKDFKACQREGHKIKGNKMFVGQPNSLPKLAWPDLPTLLPPIVNVPLVYGLEGWFYGTIYHQILFAFYDPCHLPNNPGWPLRNYLAFVSARWNIKKVQFLCYRENHGFADFGLSLVGEALIQPSQAWQDREHVPNAVGWELNRGKRVHRCINLSTSMDPTRMAISAADLNLKLMKWRAFPSLNLSMLSSTKCLLLGAGALGCQVARMLMAWGVRKMTLVDSGKVAMSNLLWQSLYTLEDCLVGEFKALAAVRSLKRIFPAAEAEAIVMAIPMPGHPVPSQEEQNVLADCERLLELVESHDVVFLLTDTRESRWLPTLLCANTNKLTITAAALGSDSFLVMCHGAGPLIAPDESKTEAVGSLSACVADMSLTQSDSKLRLGCYFCNDVVAPVDSTANRTSDQQCTVTDPDLAPTASALAVELLVEILHHPLGGSSEQPLGILAHQIRGFLSQLSLMTLVGHSSNSCIACCPIVAMEYRKRRMNFVLQAINHPTYLDDLTGLTEMMKSAWQDRELVPNAVGWELNRGKRVPRCINLSTSMDPTSMAISAASSNLSMLSSTKCLLLGAGTLGCQVARMLMAWGVRKITLVDSGKVAMSNPLRQSLFTFEDCLDGGSFKALAAAKLLKRLSTAVEAEGIVMAIPMPGHPMPTQQEQSVLEDCKRLRDLVESHDAVFLLTDTRESRWLPTLLCANANKLTITAALGFDTFLVMRHGTGPLSPPDESKAESVGSLSASGADMSLTQSDSKLRLGCYFCNDVVAPVDSTTNRTLDQQCTVTRPGLAPMASGFAVKLLVGILHHPLGISAEAEFANTVGGGSSEQPLGILAHQIRGSLSQLPLMILVGHSSNSCTACCPIVVMEYRKRGMDFVLQAINHPKYLEDLTGLTELMKSANSFELDWDNETDNDDDCVEI